MVPQPVKGEVGLVQVDTTWGIIQPLQVADGVRTVDETEVNEFQEKGLPIINTVLPWRYARLGNAGLAGEIKEKRERVIDSL